MSFSDERKEKVKKQFKEKTANLCTSCGFGEFRMTDIVPVRTALPATSVYNTVAFVCARCGHYQFYHLNFLEK